MFKDTPTFSSFTVNDLNAAKTFYVQALGLDVEETPMGLNLKLATGASVFIYSKPDHTPAVFTVLNFKVNDIDQAVDELVSKGVMMERYDDLPAPLDDKGILRGLAANQGPDIAWFKDPSGNILSVLQS